jgi:hypothetical protein
MTALLDERLRVLAAQTHTLEEKVSSLGWMAGAGALRMLADDVEIMAREKEMGGGQ